MLLSLACVHHDRDEELEVPGSLDEFTLENQNAVQERKELIQKWRERRREKFRAWSGSYESKMRNSC